MQYSKKLLAHFQHPHNQGKMKNPDGVGQVGNIKCGDIMKIYIKVGKNNSGDNFVKDIKFETLGCAAAIAATSVLTDLAKGKTFAEAQAITKQDIVDVLENVPPIKHHCSVLAEEALQKAIEDFEASKQ